MSDLTRTLVSDATGKDATATLDVGGAKASISYAAAGPGEPVWMWTLRVDGSEIASHTNEYNAAKRVTKQGDFGLDIHYTYGASGKVSSQEIESPYLSYTGYGYTDAGRLASVETTFVDQVNHTVTESSVAYAYGSAGNVTTAGAMRLAYAGSRLASSTVGAVTTGYVFDSLGRRTSQASSVASATYTWDPHADRLLSYSHRSRGATDVVAAYLYDASGQRTRSVVTSGSITTTTSYTYEGTSLLRLVSVSPSRTTTLSYLYDSGGRAQVCAVQTSERPGTYLAGLRSTLRGDVVAYTDLSADPRVAKAFAYEEYGTISHESTLQANTALPAEVLIALESAQPLRYAGYVYDSFSGLYYCSQRYLDPQSCQWISADPALADGEESAYQYCGGDPVNKTDPSGLISDVEADAWGATFARYKGKRGIAHAVVHIVPYVQTAKRVHASSGAMARRAEWLKSVAVEETHYDDGVSAGQYSFSPQTDCVELNDAACVPSPQAKAAIGEGQPSWLGSLRPGGTSPDLEVVARHGSLQLGVGAGVHFLRGWGWTPPPGAPHWRSSWEQAFRTKRPHCSVRGLPRQGSVSRSLSALAFTTGRGM